MYRIFVLCLLACVAFCGCSDRKAAQKRLRTDAEKLTYQYIDHLLNKQIALNSQGSSQAYSISQDRIWLVKFDGIELYPMKSAHNDLAEYAVARHYVGQELFLNVPGVVMGSLVAVDHERYTYRSSLEIKIYEQRSIWKHTPGMPVRSVVFKQNDTPEMRKQLLSSLPAVLPDELADLKALYHAPDEVKVRTYEENVFICYDPSLPGWVLEDPQYMEKVTLPGPPAEWDRQGFYPGNKLPEGVKEYNKQLYWQDSAFIKSQYDKGFIYRWNKWFKTDIAKEMANLKEYCRKFDHLRADLNQLTAFMEGLGQFSDGVDFTEALSQAEGCAQRLISQWRNNSQYNELVVFNDMLKNNLAYKKLAKLVEKNCKESIELVKKRHNKSIAETMKKLDAAGETMRDTFNRTDMSAMQLNIVFERLRDSLVQDKGIDSGKLCESLKILNYCLLLRGEHVIESNIFFNTNRKDEELRNIRKNTRKRCVSCVYGKKDCRHCVNKPGMCERCQGEVLNSEGKICTLCKGDGKCLNCHGELKVICVRCQGRGFVLVKDKLDKYCQENLQKFQALLERCILDQMDKRYE